MKNRKIPMRSCVITREKLPKVELLRIVRTTDGMVIADISGKVNGRGAYICNHAQCLEKAIKSKGLSHSLKINLSQEIIEKLREEI